MRPGERALENDRLTRRVLDLEARLSASAVARRRAVARSPAMSGRTARSRASRSIRSALLVVVWRSFTEVSSSRMGIASHN